MTEMTWPNDTPLRSASEKAISPMATLSGDSAYRTVRPNKASRLATSNSGLRIQTFR